MSKLYACLITEEVEKSALLAVATEFAYRIELLEDGVLFDLSGLEKLIGTPKKIMAAILEAMELNRVAGNLAVEENLETAILLARQGKGFAVTAEKLSSGGSAQPLFENLPLSALPIEKETLSIFEQLGWQKVRDLKRIPGKDLISRYGKEFIRVLDLINEKQRRILTPNVADDFLAWQAEPDFAVADFAQLMLLIETALSELFPPMMHDGYSTELVEIYLLLDDEAQKIYEVKASRPTLEQRFWLKIIYLKMSAEPPVAAVKFIKVTANFAKPRPVKKGLFAVTRPEPESLLLTVNKLKKLLGNENVGVPVLLDERLPEAFLFDAEKLPEGVEKREVEVKEPSIGFSYFVPPLTAQVLIRRKTLIYLKTDRFAGRVLEYSGVWKKSSRWWNKPWKTYEWDVELENAGIYRLSRYSKEDWFVTGEYD